MRPSAKLIFLICLIVYAAITPWVARHAWATGDEPAYMILAHSIIVDHDFDVSNNYRAKDYRFFYPYELEGAADQHSVTNARGEQLLWHDVGTSLVIAPGFWAAGR